MLLILKLWCFFAGGALAEGFQDRLKEFQSFERTFEASAGEWVMHPLLEWLFEAGVFGSCIVYRRFYADSSVGSRKRGCAVLHLSFRKHFIPSDATAISGRESKRVYLAPLSLAGNVYLQCDPSTECNRMCS